MSTPVLGLTPLAVLQILSLMSFLMMHPCATPRSSTADTADSEVRGERRDLQP